MTDELSDRYEEHHRERRADGEFVFVPERIPLFQAAIGRGKRVLDLGCRSGALTRHFLEGNEVVGLDVDRAALDKAEALGIQPVQANVEEPLPFEDASFDAVVAGELFEHLQFPDALVAEIRRVLRPGGVIVGSVPNAYRLQGRLRVPPRPRARGRSRRICACSRRRALRELLAGFEDVRAVASSAAATGGCTRACSRATSCSAAEPLAPEAPRGARCRPRRPCGRRARRSRPCRRRRAGRDPPSRSRSTPGAGSSTRRGRARPGRGRAPRRRPRRAPSRSGRSRARPGCRGSGGSPRMPGGITIALTPNAVTPSVSPHLAEAVALAELVDRAEVRVPCVSSFPPSRWSAVRRNPSSNATCGSYPRTRRASSTSAHDARTSASRAGS